MEDGLLFYTLTGVAIVSVVAVVFGVSLMRWRNRRLQNLQRQFKKLEHIFKENQRRVQLLETHALEYMNSLGEEARRSYLLAKEILNSMQGLVERLDTDLNLQDLGSILDAQEILSHRFVLRSNAMTGISSQMQLLPPMTTDELERKFDELFSVVGQDIAKASDRAYFEFHTKNRARRMTLEDIVEAGIHIARRAGKRITSSFRSPFTK